MKPLIEWTEKELREWLLFPPYNSGPNADDILAELLRRERERCAVVCDQLADDHWATTDSEQTAQTAQSCATRIRGLQ